MPQGDFIALLLQETLWSNRVQISLYIPDTFTSCPNDLPLITHKKQNTNLIFYLKKKKKQNDSYHTLHATIYIINKVIAPQHISLWKGCSINI